MNTPLVHPLDVASGTGDREAAGETWVDRPARHLSADADDEPRQIRSNAAWRNLPPWIDIPLRPLMTEHPAVSAVTVASLFLFAVALVML